MSDRLATYLNDHMAGARIAIGLLETLRDEHPDEHLRQSAGELLEEVEEDRQQLQQIIDRVGGGVGRLKAATAWLGEKVTPVSAGLGADPPLGTLEVLEALALGVLGKRGLWSALQTVSDDRLPPLDLTRLIERAQVQHARIESHRLDAARGAFSPEAQSDSPGNSPLSEP